MSLDLTTRVSLRTGQPYATVQQRAAAESQLKHGLYGDKLYWIWGSLKGRCFNPKNPQYKNYGARGITVCEGWRNSFLSFYEDNSPRSEGLTLDRTDNNGPYSCGHCTECLAKGWIKNTRWVTQSTQNSNKRRYRKTNSHRGTGRGFAKP